MLHLIKLFKMLLIDALKLSKQLIDANEENKDRKHVTGLADKYKKLITGDNIGSLLVQFVQREDKALFEQRLKLTKAITPAVAASIRKPFNKVVRNDRVRKSWKMSTETRNATVNTMVKSFFGAARKQNRGLDYWMKTRFLELQFTDPNAWVVLDWKAPQTPAEVVTPRPFEVSSTMAQNWLIINDEVKWLFVCQDITFFTASTLAIDSKVTKKSGKRYTLYEEDFTVVYEQADENYIKQSGYVFKPGETAETIKNVYYLVRYFEPKVGYVPAFRVGYLRDEVTDGRTFVNPWHDALCYFEKSLKTVSEMDLTMALHVFPQKLQYVQKCIGEERNGRAQPCRSGRMANGDICKTCKGAGYQIHTTAADVINVPMPEDAKDMFNLDQMLVYKAPPIETVKFQNEYILQLEKQCHQAVFNSQVFIKKQTAGSDPSAGGDVAQTATEADFNMQSVYDALEPFTEKYSELWMDILTTFAIIAGDKIETIKVVHQFPADYKLKTSDVLLAERRTASNSGAPSFMIATIDDDLADILYNGDDLNINKYYVKRRYFPFPGKTADEVALLLASAYVPKYFKVLYSNFDEIFKEIEKTNPEIWTDKEAIAKTDGLVKAKVEEYIQRVDQQNPSFNLNAFRDANPAGDGTEEEAE